MGWTVQHTESAAIAKALIAQAAQQQVIPPCGLTVHADRGSSMTSKPVAFLLADLGITKTHSRPYTSSDNPYLRSALQDPEAPARIPRSVLLHRRSAELLSRVLRLVQPPPSPFRNRPHGSGCRSPRPGRRAACEADLGPCPGLSAHPGALRPSAATATSAPHCRLDQQAQGGCTLIADADRLIRLDRLRVRQRLSARSRTERLYTASSPTPLSPAASTSTSAPTTTTQAENLMRVSVFDCLGPIRAGPI